MVPEFGFLVGDWGPPTGGGYRPTICCAPGDLGGGPGIVIDLGIGPSPVGVIALCCEGYGNPGGGIVVDFVGVGLRVCCSGWAVFRVGETEVERGGKPEVDGLIGEGKAIGLPRSFSQSFKKPSCSRRFCILVDLPRCSSFCGVWGLMVVALIAEFVLVFGSGKVGGGSMLRKLITLTGRDTTTSDAREPVLAETFSA